MADQPQSVTSIGVSPEAERRVRTIKYTVAMSVRVVCLIVGVMVPNGPVMWVAFAGAILLPYFAVVIANSAGTGQTKRQSQAKSVAPTLTISADAFTFADKPKND